jgi:basic membrane protein A
MKSSDEPPHRGGTFAGGYLDPNPFVLNKDQDRRKEMKRRRIRLLPILAPLTIIALLLTACGGAATPTPEMIEPTEPPLPTEPPPTDVPTAKPPTPTEEAGPLQILFLYDGVADDEGWNAQHELARQAIEQEYGDLVTTEIAENVPWTPAAANIVGPMIKAGVDVVIDTGAFTDVITRVIEENPDVLFETISFPQADNVTSYVPDSASVDYLLGMAAGLLTETNELGYLCAYAMDMLMYDVNAFHFGARSVNPDVTTNVSCLMSYYNPAGARAATKRMVEGGVDSMYGIAGYPAYVESAGDLGAWAAGSYGDASAYAPETYVNSIMYNFTPYLVSEVGMILDGTWEGGRFELLPFGEGANLGEWGENVPQAVRDQVEAMRVRMLDEGYNPFVGPMVDANGVEQLPAGEGMTIDQVLAEWLYLLDGIVGYE